MDKQQEEPNYLSMKHANQILKRASDEIEILRERNKLMHVRLKMFDDCMSLIDARGLQRAPGMSHSGEDIIHEIRKFVKENEIVDGVTEKLTRHPKNFGMSMPEAPDVDFSLGQGIKPHQ